MSEIRSIPGKTSYAEVGEDGEVLDWPTGYTKGWLIVEDALVYGRSGDNDLAGTDVKRPGDAGTTTVGNITTGLDIPYPNGALAWPVAKEQKEDTKFAVRPLDGQAARVWLVPRHI